LAPFDDAATGCSFRSQLVVIDGLDLAAGIEVGTVGHEGARVLFTGSGAQGKGASIDQFLAEDCGLGTETPLASLVLAVGDDRTSTGNCVSYSRLGQPVPKWIDPVRVFDELFGETLSGASGGVLAQQRLEGKSVLDFVRQDLARLRSRAGAGDREKLEQHQTALREIEKRLNPPRRTPPTLTRPDAKLFPKLLSSGGGEPYFEHITELMSDLLAQALTCDMTRFASFMLPDLSRTRLYSSLPSDVHAEVAHRYAARTEKGPGNPASWELLALQNRHSYQQVARLLHKLQSSGVLTHTLVYACSDMGDPSRHSSRNVPTVLAGGVNGRFKMGRTIDLRSTKGDKLIPHNRLLVSILHAFGVEREQFGTSANPATVTGPLSELG
jgi:hypothetical protein